MLSSAATDGRNFEVDIRAIAAAKDWRAFGRVNLRNITDIAENGDIRQV
jgi:hypothetical protein